MSAPVYSAVATSSLEASLTSGGLRVGLASAPAALALAPHAHREANLLFVLAGGLDQRVGRRRYWTDGGSALEKAGAVVHSDRFGRVPSRLLFVEVLGERLDAVRDQLGLFRRAVAVHPGAPRRLLAALVAELERPHPTPLAVEALALEALVAVSSRESSRRGDPLASRPRWLDRTLELLDARLADPPPLAELAAAASIEPERLAAAFRRHLGEAPIDWVRRRRVEEAAHRLATAEACGRPSLADLAAELGFADQPHMTRSFRRLLGTTPAAFLRRRGR
jgi:AraC-like DNA-binding protein